MKRCNFILYVQDQECSTAFYTKVLGLTPTLHVPGMTEFTLNSGAVLGLMPERGIKALLGAALKDPATANGIPRCELYLTVEDPKASHLRSLAAGGIELSPLLEHDWGDRAAYSSDLDGHVLVFAEAVMNRPHAPDP